MISLWTIKFNLPKRVVLEGRPIETCTMRYCFSFGAVRGQNIAESREAYARRLCLTKWRYTRKMLCLSCETTGFLSVFANSLPPIATRKQTPMPIRHTNLSCKVAYRHQSKLKFEICLCNEKANRLKEKRRKKRRQSR